MNLKRLGALLLFLLGILIALQNFYIAFFEAQAWKLRLYYFLLGLAVLFLSGGARYMWKKLK